MFPTLKASELCEERAELVRWLEDSGTTGGQQSWSMGLGPTSGAAERRSATRWATSLRAASLTYTTTRLTRTALAAGDAFDDYQLEPHHLPSPHGLIAWEEPITAQTDLHVVSGMAITGASWAVHGNAVEIRWWTDKSSWVTDWSAGNPAANVPKLNTEQTRAVYKMHPTKTVAVGCSALRFGKEKTWPSVKMPPPPGSTFSDAGEYALAARRLVEAEKTLLATWLLMKQTLVTDTPVQASRSSCARINRIDPALLGTVRQVALRHKNISPDRVGTVDGPKREYAYRSLINGHWRNQPYPLRLGYDENGNVRTDPIWISDYFRGPEDAPLLDPSKLVNVLRR